MFKYPYITQTFFHFQQLPHDSTKGIQELCLHSGFKDENIDVNLNIQTISEIYKLFWIQLLSYIILHQLQTVPSRVVYCISYKLFFLELYVFLVINCSLLLI